jgi:amino acid transporter
MELPRNLMALAVALVVNVVIVILLTPVGFENRPQADLLTVGLIAIGTIFTGLALFVASLLLIFRSKVRLASILTIVASLLFFFPIVGDRTGSFFSVPTPPAIDFLETVFFVVLLVTLFLAWNVYRDNEPSPR